MTFQIRPAVRENTPVIVGLAGPTKSGKTKSAHRLAQGLAAAMGGGPVVMLNAEGARGHQYADQYKYLACDIEPPYSYKRYTEAVKEIAKLNPGVLIVDSMSHAHDGPGGMLEQHDKIIDRMSGGEAKTLKERDRYTFAAWAEPKADENEFIYTLLSLKCPVIVCFRAKEKIQLRKKAGGGTEVVDLGWQPIASDRIAFETLFTLLLPPHCKGVPDLEHSDMREPFDKLVKPEPISEALGAALAEWARGGQAPDPRASPAASTQAGEPPAGKISADQVRELSDALALAGVPVARLLAAMSRSGKGVTALKDIAAADFKAAKDWIARAGG